MESDYTDRLRAEEEQKIRLSQHPALGRIIRRSEDYVVDGIGKVTVLTAVDAQRATDNGEPLVLYSAYAVLGVQTPQGVQPFPVEWLMSDVSSIDDAFDKFQDQAKATLVRNMQEARARAEEQERQKRSQILVPQGTNMKLVT